MLSHHIQEGARDSSQREAEKGDRNLANDRTGKFQPTSGRKKGIEIQPTRRQENDGQRLYKQRDSDTHHHCALLQAQLAGAQ